VKNPKKPTPQQQAKVVDLGGLVVIQACPGSGKTFAVAARVARMLRPWGEGRRNGMAILSFTNVAWRQIHKELTESFGIQEGLHYPHFLGTIDSFVNRYIFLPFGHFVMGCARRPELVGEPFGTWHAGGYHAQQFTNLRYDINGQLKVVDKRALKHGQAGITQQLEQTKRRLNRAGFATQIDADYFAMRVIQNYPVIAKALARRFTVVMVDEAQDSSDIQMQILDLLVEHGIEDMLLIGDPDQAIFEWRDAKPELLAKKSELDSWKEKAGCLTDNRRSSQHICDFTWKLTGRSGPPPCAVNENNAVRDCTACPEIWGYDEKVDCQSIVTRFLELCRKHGIEPNRNSVAVLARSRNLLKRIVGISAIQRGTEPWGDPITGELLHIKALAEGDRYPEAWKRARRILATIHLGKTNVSGAEIRQVEQERGLVELRKLTHELVTALPAVGGSLEQWCTAANPKWEGFCRSCKAPAPAIPLVPKQRKAHRDVDLTTVISPEELPLTQAEYRLGTVHSVKGETLEAVLLFLGKKTARGKQYRTLLIDGTTTLEEEEFRIPYVAMTRPRRILVLAVPHNDVDEWRKRLVPGEPEAPPTTSDRQ